MIETMTLDGERLNRLLPHLQSGYRPEPIRRLKDEIERKTKVAEFLRGRNSRWDAEMVEAIVQMKLELDGLYLAWAKGEIE